MWCFLFSRTKLCCTYPCKTVILPLCAVSVNTQRKLYLFFPLTLYNCTQSSCCMVKLCIVTVQKILCWHIFFFWQAAVLPLTTPAYSFTLLIVDKVQQDFAWGGRLFMGDWQMLLSLITWHQHKIFLCPLSKFATSIWVNVWQVTWNM